MNTDNGDRSAEPVCMRWLGKFLSYQLPQKMREQEASLGYVLDHHVKPVVRVLLLCKNFSCLLRLQTDTGALRKKKKRTITVIQKINVHIEARTM